MSSRLVLSTLFQAVSPADAAGGAVWSDSLGVTSPLGWAPMVFLGGPAIMAVVLIWLYVRTARQHRRALMAPPVWLLPYLERPDGPPVDWPPPAPDADHAELEEVRMDSTARLARRKRILLVGLGLNFVAGWAGAAMYLYSANRSVEFQELVPLPVLGASLDTTRFQGLEDAGALEQDRELAPAPVAAETVPVDTARLRIRNEFLARRRDSLAEVRRLDSLAVLEEVAQRVRDSVAQVVRDSITQAQAAAVPAPAPPPAPPPAAPAVDPTVELARAAAVIRGRVEALAAAINGRTGLQGLLAAGPARERFLRFVEQQAPTVAVDRVPDPTMSTDRAEAEVTLQFQWRGQFGVSRREVGRFRVEAGLVNGAWQVVRLVPLNIPQ